MALLPTPKYTHLHKRNLGISFQNSWLCATVYTFSSLTFCGGSSKPCCTPAQAASIGSSLRVSILELCATLYTSIQYPASSPHFLFQYTFKLCDALPAAIISFRPSPSKSATCRSSHAIPLSSSQISFHAPEVCRTKILMPTFFS